MLTLAHDYLMLALDDETGECRGGDLFVRHSVIAAAFIAEMMFRGRLLAVQAHRFQLAPGPLSSRRQGAKTPRSAKDRLTEASRPTKHPMSAQSPGRRKPPSDTPCTADRRMLKLA